MGRKKKPANNSGIPEYAIERFSRYVWEDIRNDYEKPEVQAEFARWLTEREANKERNKATVVRVPPLGK